MGERFGVEKLAMNLFDPSGLAANIPRGTDVARTVLHTHAHSIARLELASAPAHGSPHFSSNSACFRSISSRIRMFFSTRIVSMLAIQRSRSEERRVGKECRYRRRAS